MDKLYEYKLDTEEIKKRFFPNGSINHKHNSKFKLLPYVANDKKLVVEFSGVVGQVSRMICDKALEETFDVDKFINDVVEKVAEFEGNNSNEIFKDILKTMFLENGSLVDFDIDTINYIQSNNDDNKIAKFIFNILFNEDLKSTVKNSYNKKTDNILYELILSSLPELKNKEYTKVDYQCYLPFVKELFIKDFKFISCNEELYKNSIKRLLEYYYMFYVSQLIVKLNKFEKSDMTRTEKIYYTLDWESTSKNRTAYKFGWELIKGNIDSMFSHVVTLELLNHHTLNQQLSYQELNELFNSTDSESVKNEVVKVFNIYVQGITDVSWIDFKEQTGYDKESSFKEVYKLFDAVEYQFRSSGRERAYKAYKSWFVQFVYSNFAKKRGQLGYNLNITEDDIILMTKICINDKGRMKLKTLFEELELRGLFFDRDSKTKIIQLYEKLNLLEKKSDSGDAQYVRSIL